MMSRKTRINATMGALIALTALGLWYFGALVDKHASPPEEAGIEVSAGTREADAPAGLAQFRADCRLEDGRQITGETNVSQELSPGVMDEVYVKTADGASVRVEKPRSYCTFAPF